MRPFDFQLNVTFIWIIFGQYFRILFDHKMVERYRQRAEPNLIDYLKST